MHGSSRIHAATVFRNQTDAERAAREDAMNRGMRALTPKELAARTGDGLTNAWPWAQNGLPRDSGDR